MYVCIPYVGMQNDRSPDCFLGDLALDPYMKVAVPSLSEGACQVKFRAGKSTSPGLL